MSSKLLQSTFVIGLMTLVSRISGLIRDNIFAQVMGSQMVADVFFVAFRIPNFFRRLFGEGAFSAAFVPVFAEYDVNHSAEDGRRFLALVSGRLMLILLGVTLVGVIFAPALISLIAPGFRKDPAAFSLAVDVTRIMFPYLFFISLVALSAGILNTKGRFAVPAFTPVILNICMISGAWFFASRYSHATYAIAVSVFVAGFLQLMFQLPFLYKVGSLTAPRVRAIAGDDVAVEGAVRVYRLTLPALFGVSIAQINLLINTALATMLATGSVSWLYYSQNKVMDRECFGSSTRSRSFLVHHPSLLRNVDVSLLDFPVFQNNFPGNLAVCPLNIKFTCSRREFPNDIGAAI